MEGDREKVACGDRGKERGKKRGKKKWGEGIVHLTSDWSI
jgi:hypothetical protein